jgi:hypothetical protein
VANSIFIGQLASSSGGTINPSLPIAFPDGAINAPSITFANETTLGFFRAGSGIVDLSINSYSALTPMARFQGNIGLIMGGGVFIAYCTAAGAGSTATFVTRSVGAGQFNMSATVTEAAGTGFDVSTDAVLKIRTRAQTGYATIDCLGLKASGSAGANFGPSAVASLTIVNGIVTAAS